MTFDDFIGRAWDDHAGQPEAVAERLAVSLDRIGDGAQLMRYATLATHVCGEHLGQWQRGIDVLDALRALPAAGGTAARAALDRHGAALRHAAGDPRALDALPRDERVAALAAVASIFAGQKQVQPAIDAYAQALAGTHPPLAEGSPGIRALAVGGNNLAAALEQHAARTHAQTHAMVEAAQAALRYWKLAGTWLEEERAHYRLCKSQLAATAPAAALDSAAQCAAICARNDAPAFERFFAQAALAQASRATGDAAAADAARARALALLDTLADDEKSLCDDDVRALQG